MAYKQKTYTESDSVKNFREQMEAQAGMKPADYTSKWQDQLDTTMGNILNRKDFQYDVNSDALYNMYKDRYVNLGQNAMMDTMGQAAKLTGGYGNSNAQIVGQQAYQGYLQGLTDKIPELAQLAYQRYAQQGQDLYQKYGLLNTQEQMDYGRWNDSYNQWLNERDYIANLYNTERGFDYGQFRDTVGDDQWKAQFDEDLRRYELARKGSGGGGGGGGGYSGGGGSRTPGSNAYAITEEMLKAAGTGAKDMTNVIAGAPITTNQKVTLHQNYVAPAAKAESEKKNNKDTSAHWSR